MKRIGWLVCVLAVAIAVILVASAVGLGWYSGKSSPGTTSSHGPPANPGGAPSVYSTVSLLADSAHGSDTPVFASHPGDAIFVWLTLNNGSTVTSVTDSSHDTFNSIALAGLAAGTLAYPSELTIWAATDVAGGSAVTVNVSLAPGCATCDIDSVVLVVDVTQVLAAPILAVGSCSDSSVLAGEESAGFTSSVPGVWGDFVLGGAAAFAAESFSAASTLALVNERTGPGIGTGPTTSSVVFATNGGESPGAVWINGTDAHSSAWIACAVALAPLVPPAPPPTYPVFFFENGLPYGTSWTVTFDGQTFSGTSPTRIDAPVLNGQYHFAIGAVAGYVLKSAASGTVTVDSTPVTELANYTATASTGTPIQHVVVILMENQEMPQLVSLPNYFGYLNSNFGSASQFYAVCHGSPPDYLAMTSGRDYNFCGASYLLPQTSAENLPDLLQAAGDSWGAYMEGMPVPCDPNPSAPGQYLTQHDPFLSYADIVTNTSRCDSHVVNSAAFNTSLSEGLLPNVSWYVPNGNDDCYASNVSVCSQWLQGFLGSILNNTNPVVRNEVDHTAFLVTFDEGETNLGYTIGGITNSWCQNETGTPLSVCGGHTFLSMVSPWSVGTQYTPLATDYNIATTIEWLFGLGSDGGYDGTPDFPSMSGLFSFGSN
jgi:Phosphoesterase family